ncbi:hypothetical protein LPJGGPFB_01120 [Ensifer adhaerens]|uniref:hypothetical protein n=1 Tax=Ensifer adhaerens TaxID=106592 RepID=UPI001567C6E8|nr:hypothetical protein [Ensifer adhaerens]NRP17893.1 hypothetical protein [Ensifer adhaerens]
MAEDRIEVSRGGLARLHSVPEDFVRAEIARTGGVAIDELRALVKEKQVLPALRKMRAGLFDRLDGHSCL